MSDSKERPILCKHCGKEILDTKIQAETCPKQSVLNGIRLSHGLEFHDYMRLELKRLEALRAEQKKG